MKAPVARLGRVYARLPPKQAATLILRHIADGRQPEAERAKAAVPIRHGLTMRDPETLNRYNQIRVSVMYWEALHWRNQVAFLCALNDRP